MTEVEAWKIDWFECKADGEDVAAGTAKKVGDIFWRVPRSIGPIRVEHDHWAGWHIDAEEEQAKALAQFPRLIDVLGKLLVSGSDPEVNAYALKVYYEATNQTKT